MDAFDNSARLFGFVFFVLGLNETDLRRYLVLKFGHRSAWILIILEPVKFNLEIIQSLLPCLCVPPEGFFCFRGTGRQVRTFARDDQAAHFSLIVSPSRTVCKPV